MAEVTSRNVYTNTTFYLITIKEGKLNLKAFTRVGQKERGIEFINQTKNISKEDHILIGSADDIYPNDIEPTIITDIEKQRLMVFEYLKKKYSTFIPESVDL